MSRRNPELSLFCRVGTRLCAVLLEHVEETMRPLPVEPIAGMPAFVRGLAIIRGAPVPVVDAASVLGGDASHPTRFVTVKMTGDRRVALAVDEVVGIGEIPQGSLQDLPPLLRDVNVHAISAIGTLDAELLMVLSGARLVPQDIWTRLATGHASS